MHNTHVYFTLPQNQKVVFIINIFNLKHAMKSQQKYLFNKTSFVHRPSS